MPVFSRKSMANAEEKPLPRPAYETYYAKKAGRDRYGERMFALRLAWLLGALFFGMKMAFARTGNWVVDLEMAALTGFYTGVGAWGLGRVMALLGVRTIRGAIGGAVVVVAIMGTIQNSNFNWGMTVERAQKEAVRRHPQLAVANSPLNREFVTRFQRYQVTEPEYFQRNDWPLRLADECETELRGGAR